MRGRKNLYKAVLYTVSGAFLLTWGLFFYFVAEAPPPAVSSIPTKSFEAVRQLKDNPEVLGSPEAVAVASLVTPTVPTVVAPVSSAGPVQTVLATSSPTLTLARPTVSMVVPTSTPRPTAKAVAQPTPLLKSPSDVSIAGVSPGNLCPAGRKARAGTPVYLQWGPRDFRPTQYSFTFGGWETLDGTEVAGLCRTTRKGTTGLVWWVPATEVMR